MEQILAPPPPPQTSNLPPQETWMMVTAVNETLHNALASDPKVIMFGEDVEDPKGGVFGITKGLSSKYPERIVNSPLAEASIAGIGGGLAMAGYKPVFEIQFIDFALPAFNQIANQIATLRWRSNGAFKCPLVLIAPCGAYLPSGGPWHSQTAEGLYAHLPGLQIVMPSTPHDASSLLKASIASDDPVLFLLPKHLFRKHFQAVPDEPLTLGEAIVRVEGQDATAVVWGNCVEVAIEAAEKLAKEDIALEVVDLQTLVPCDWKTIQESVAKTGRLIVVQEDNVTCSFGQAIVSEIISRPESWDVMAAPPQLITRPDVHIAYHAILEEHILPSVAQVCDAVRKSMRY
ncbi:MAG: transketolase C-terminal domain-containing protein, partial [bacterium]